MKDIFTTDNVCEGEHLQSDRVPTLEDVPEVFKGSLIPHFITGSVRFGLQTKDSDLDICVPIFMLGSIKTKEMKESNYHKGQKYKKEGIVINIIPLHPLEYVVWFKVAKIIDACNVLKGHEKPMRLGLYETLIGIVRTALSNEVITSKNYMNYLD